MINAVIYDPITGKILQTMSGSLESIQAMGSYIIVDEFKPHDSEYIVQDGQLVPRDPAEILTEKTIQEETKVRNMRNGLLTDTDWVELPTASSRLTTEQLTAYLVYRQALRDIPLQEGFPLNVIWPTYPS